jgi:hypothetical protein
MPEGLSGEERRAIYKDLRILEDQLSKLAESIFPQKGEERRVNMIAWIKKYEGEYLAHVSLTDRCEPGEDLILKGSNDGLASYYIQIVRELLAREIPRASRDHLRSEIQQRYVSRRRR